MYILRQFEIIIICMPLILSINAVFWSEVKIQKKTSKASLAFWPWHHHIKRPINQINIENQHLVIVESDITIFEMV